jgi:hypothetical protein
MDVQQRYHQSIYVSFPSFPPSIDPFDPHLQLGRYPQICFANSARAHGAALHRLMDAQAASAGRFAVVACPEVISRHLDRVVSRVDQAWPSHVEALSWGEVRVCD